LRRICSRECAHDPKIEFIGDFSLAMTGAAPAQAFCIDNKSSYAVRVHLETASPFGKFAARFKQGKKGAARDSPSVAIRPAHAMAC